MSATSTLDLLFQELREAIQNSAGASEIIERYMNVVDEFPQLTMTDVVDYFEEWLKAREDEERYEREKARNFMNDHFKIISVM
jgi:hypothetical protein